MKTSIINGSEVSRLSVAIHKASDAYSNELFTAMESEIDVLMQQAAEDSQRKAEEQAEAEQAEMRDRLRSLLNVGAKV